MCSVHLVKREMSITITYIIHSNHQNLTQHDFKKSTYGANRTKAHLKPISDQNLFGNTFKPKPILDQNTTQTHQISSLLTHPKLKVADPNPSLAFFWMEGPISKPTQISKQRIQSFKHKGIKSKLSKLGNLKECSMHFNTKKTKKPRKWLST